MNHKEKVQTLNKSLELFQEVDKYLKRSFCLFFFLVTPQFFHLLIEHRPAERAKDESFLLVVQPSTPLGKIKHYGKTPLNHKSPCSGSKPGWEVHTHISKDNSV